MPADKEKLLYKNKLKQWGADQIQQRVLVARGAMQQAQDAANSEEKSSAGDKYETGRAMGHLQKDMHARQLAAAIQELALLQAVPTETHYREGAPGAVLEVEGMIFFISVGLGKQQVEGQTVLFLSPQAPLAKLLLGKHAGESILFNEKTVVLKEVY